MKTGVLVVHFHFPEWPKNFQIWLSDHPDLFPMVCKATSSFGIALPILGVHFQFREWSKDL